MFSGIKSILFGYSEPDNSVNNELISESASSTAAASSCNKTTSKTSEKSLSSDTSALLEQTLTAATTKFTEQLLPPSPSIEQLQSSSHQLLPTLTEQHEEENLKRIKQNQLLDDGANQPDEQDDECLDVDSWEMLDLVEKPQVNSLNSTVQGDSGDRSSGILKQAGKDSALSQRPKPKVSFDTPDLVSDKQKIEPTTKPKDNPKPGSSRSRNKKKSKQTKVTASLPIAGQPTIEKVSDGGKPIEVCAPTQEVKVVETEVVQNVPQSTTECPKQGNGKLPALNYAAALHKRKDGGEQSKISDAKPIEVTGRPKPVTRGSIFGLNTVGPSKRNRPVSSSSWSSSDEIEAVDSVWNCGEEKPKHDDVFKKADEETGPADHESLVSSGFSECDYGYGDLNDFYVRPRKGQNKRRGVSAISNPLLASMSKRGGDRDLNKKQPDSSAGSLCSKVTVVKGKVDTFKSIKPKKKKMVMTPNTRSDFLKKCSAFENCGSAESAPASGSAEPRAELDSPFVRPPAPPAPNANNSGNDSSDLADMDESWYVTPPPCFTGVNTLSATQPKAKEAARENELIEHPAIYIASGSKHLETVAPSVKSSTSSIQTKPKAIVLKKVNRQSVATGFNGKSDAKKKSTATVVSQPRAAKKQKAWDNKFIIDVWDEEQDDVDDFDNLFKSERTQPSSGKAKKSAKAKKTATETKPIEPALIDDEPAADYESDFSIPSPTPVDISEESSIEVVLTEDLAPLMNDENIVPTATLETMSPSNKLAGERKASVQVRPIEPERQPGWQLRKRRSKRRSLATTPANNVGRKGKLVKECRVEQTESVDANASSSARSTPTLIDRIGSSIVANLTNLTNGFPGGSIQMPPRSAIEEVEKLNQSVVRGSGADAKLVARRRLSRSFIDRQNDCVKMGNSNRRSDRRVKMFSTINGVSVNRKVQTSFH